MEDQDHPAVRKRRQRVTGPPCGATVWAAGWSHHCPNRAKKDGYCKIHHPDAVQARADKSRSNWDARRKHDEEVMAEAERLGRELGVPTTPDYSHGARGYTKFIIISFSDAQRLIDRLRKLTLR